MSACRCAAAPSRMEWLMNNIRMRHNLPPAILTLLPSGTTSNESLHAEINSWFRQVQRVHKASLRLKLQAFSLSKGLVHDRGLTWPTARQLQAGTILARATASPVWTPKTWRAWCRTLRRAHAPGTNKASLPIQGERQLHVAALRGWVSKKPAAVKRPAASKRRTVLNRKRVHQLIRGGVKDTPFKRQAA